MFAIPLKVGRDSTRLFFSSFFFCRRRAIDKRIYTRTTFIGDDLLSWVRLLLLLLFLREILNYFVHVCVCACVTYECIDHQSLCCCIIYTERLEMCKENIRVSHSLYYIRICYYLFFFSDIYFWPSHSNRFFHPTVHRREWFFFENYLKHIRRAFAHDCECFRFLF